jgi:ribosome-dependent ATPase
VLDRDQSHESRAYLEEMHGSPYFLEKPALADYADLERRLGNGGISVGIEIPPRFGRDIARGRPVWVAAWVDGARPFVAQTIRGYLQGMHQLYLADPAVKTSLGTTWPPANIAIGSSTTRILTASMRWCRRQWQWSWRCSRRF